MEEDQAGKAVEEQKVGRDCMRHGKLLSADRSCRLHQQSKKVTALSRFKMIDSAQRYKSFPVLEAELVCRFCNQLFESDSPPNYALNYLEFT